MKNCNGAFLPQGRCNAKISWAQLLHALAITPEEGVLSKRLTATKGVNKKDLDAFAVRLEIDGEVICHIVNLFRELKSRDYEWIYRPAFLAGECSLRFGLMKWDSEQTPSTVEFSPASEVQLSASHFPFNGYWNDEPDKALLGYSMALKIGVSKESYAWPPRRDPLATRVAKLDENLYIASKIRQRSEKVLLTSAWLTQADHIRKRAGGSGCGDGSFEKDCFAELNKEHESDRSRRLWTEWILSRWIHPTGYAYSFGVQKDSPKLGMVFAMRDVPAVVERVLTDYNQYPEKSWRNDLYLSKDKILSVLRETAQSSEGDQSTFDIVRLDRRSCVVLTFDPSAPLWNQSLLLSC